MKKGIVMEVDDPYITLLTPDGEFLRARKMDRHYSIGEEIDFFPVADVRRKSNILKNFFTFRTVLMSLMVLIVGLGSLIPVYQSNKTYAYMSIDGSTSIEMGLNNNMEVVELKGFTKEAEKIISQLEDWKKKDASELTPIIVAELKEGGILAQTEPVVISTVKTNELKEKAETKLQENIDKIKKSINKHPVEVKMYTTTKAELEKAQDSGVPVGSYHRSKNNSAENKQKKEKIKQIKNTPDQASEKSVLPQGQQKKQEEKSSESTSNNNQPEMNNNKKPDVAEKQNNGKQPEHNNQQVVQKESDKVNRKVKQKENNNVNQQDKRNQPKQDKQKTNNHNKSKKQENNEKNKSGK
ncbi:anti-sigma factor domain-containing protein [Neobacillus niacini]|uniref:anti-sigma factor domain-containing protein n=1 Tax=Neobacillus niacini TaxID=86668 RepID=UPI003983B886